MDAPDQNYGLYYPYPPRLDDQVDVTEQTEAGLTRYVIRNRATKRYFLLKPTEYQVFRQFDGVQTLSEIAAGGKGGSGPRVSRAALVKFLTKLDSFGLIARQGGGGAAHAERKPERGLYIKISLFNPNRLLAWLDRSLSWALTKPFITASFALMLAVALGLVVRAEEAATYTSYTYAEYGLAAILLIALVINVLHEFAHGLACKHFGGDVSEVGILMIFYVLPAFYCNVTDIHRFGRKHERLWVICAGIYWQLLVSAAAAAAWLAVTPYSVLADLAFLVFLGGTINIIFNCNPLIKLDGYYALSQLVGVQNLQARSTAYARALFTRLTDGKGEKSADHGRPSPLFYLAYWACSIIYSLLLIWFVLGWAGGGLMDALGFAGVLLTLLLAALLTEKWWIAIASNIGRVTTSRLASIASQGAKIMSAQPALEKTESAQTNPADAAPSARPSRRGKVVKWALALLIVAALLAPWETSTGSDCALLLPPGREGVARANTDAVLTEIYVRPGDALAEGAKIAHFKNPEIEDRLTQLNAEIERLMSNSTRIEEELRVRSELLLSANFKEAEQKRLAGELRVESEQIARKDADTTVLPASLAVLQSDIDLRQTELDHNRREVERYKKLFEQGLVGEQQYDRAVAAMRVSERELQRSRARLEAATVDHRRLTSGVQTNSLVAETEARAARSSFEALISELHANRQQLEALRQRREILQREYDGMNIVSPKAGVVLGEDLQKMVGRRYNRGEEICRIGELEKFLLRIDVSEREISNVRLDSPVRFKLKTLPGRTFTGQVSKINSEPATNQYGQRFYPVEVVVENSDGVLRPGMTGFARISFGRQSVGLILAEKLWQALRPELWLF